VSAVRIRSEGCSNESAILVNVDLTDVLMGNNGGTFQWYFSAVQSFNGTFLKTESFNGTWPIFPSVQVTNGGITICRDNKY
jgi:hypothetical protein